MRSVLAYACLILLPLLIWTSLFGCSRGLRLDEGTKRLLAAKEALANGNQSLALQELDASIGARPNEWAYMQRAKIRQSMGQGNDAIADCEAGLALDPENKDLKWLLGELKKPKNQQFKGNAAEPPSKSK